MTLFENSNDGVALISREGIILEVNNRFCELHGYTKDSLQGAHFRILETKENEEVAKQRLERIINGKALIFETEHYKKDGTKIDLEVSSKGIEIESEFYLQSLYRDITEKKALQRKLLQAQKMESIGILAGSIAHDFDNIITSIMGNIEMLKGYSNLDDMGRKRVDLIENSAKRARILIAGLLSFTRKS